MAAVEHCDYAGGSKSGGVTVEMGCNHGDVCVGVAGVVKLSISDEFVCQAIVGYKKQHLV